MRHNSPILPELVKKTKENFDIKDFCADSAYLSVANVEEIFAAGASPFIDCKSSTTGGAGGLFEKMVHFYKFHEDDYLARYHQRSNVESTVSMIKPKFGSYIRSRSDTAMMNEAFGKIVCHNICCLIQSHCELGIEPVFWGEEKKAG